MTNTLVTGVCSHQGEKAVQEVTGALAATSLDALPPLPDGGFEDVEKVLFFSVR